MNWTVEGAAMATRITPLFFASALVIGAATMPTFPILSMNVGVREATMVIGSPRVMPSVTGAAYTADEVLEYTKTLSDGAQRTQSSVVGHLFRDALGRMRVEQLCKAAPIWLTEIFDPVDGFAYVLDDQHKIAHRMAFQPPQPEPAAANEGAVLSQTTTEKLGTQTIEGVLAEGTQTTTTVALGAKRNGHPAGWTIETWDSQELKVTVLTRSSNGYTSRLTNLSRVEPDRRRFEPPALYTVVDEKDPFAMTVTFR
jgi:hypothetical protein